ncbi:MAG: heavy-metal-associated domain-containing protein [Polynucleobacter victoriensis]
MTITLTVNGMNCGHCTQTITKAIMAIDAKATVETDIPSKTVKVSSDKSIEVLSSAISEAGYEVTATGS